MSIGFASAIASVVGQTTVAGVFGGLTTSAAPATITIDVGKADHVFKPNIVQANVGDLIQFKFFPPNHSIVRAEYGYPCIPYELMNTGKNGFFSGFKPVDAILSNPPTWTLLINDTSPIFYYCSAPGSCINYGMVGVINPNANVSLANQMQMAKDSKYMLQPGENFPTEGGSAVSPTRPSTIVSQTSNSTSTASASPDTHSSLSPSAVAGLSVGAAILIILSACLCFFIGRTKTLKEQVRLKSIEQPNITDSMGIPGTMSPASLPASIPTHHYPEVYQTGDTVYIPVKTSDLHRAYSQTRPVSRGYAHSGQIRTARGSECDVGRGAESQHIRGVSTGAAQGPAELCAVSPQRACDDQMEKE